MSEETYDGIPRSGIPWSPKINYEKCVSCGKCVDFCHMRPFGFEEKNGEKKIVVKNKNAYVFMYRGCEDICPSGAITNPSEEETQQLIEKLKNNKY